MVASMRHCVTIHSVTQLVAYEADFHTMVTLRRLSRRHFFEPLAAGQFAGFAGFADLYDLPAMRRCLATGALGRPTEVVRHEG